MHVEKVIIDDKDEFTMQYPVKNKNAVTIKKSDHLTVILYLTNQKTNNSVEKRPKKESQWNFNRKGGWETFKKLTEKETKCQKLRKDCISLHHID